MSSATDTLPLAPLQRLFATYDLAHPGVFLGGSFVLSLAVEVTGPLDVDRLQAAANALSGRHEVLRAQLGPDVGECSPDRMVQVIVDEALPRVHRGAFPDEEGFGGFVRAASELDIHAAPLWNVCVGQLAADRFLVALNVHHMISDAECVGMLMSELWHEYGTAEAPAEPEVTWRTYCLQEEERRGDPAWQESDEAHWRAFYAEGEESGYRRDMPVGGVDAGRLGYLRFALSAGFRDGFPATARAERVFASALATAIFGAAVCRELDLDEVTFNTTLTGRVLRPLRTTIGPMLWTVPVRVRRDDLPAAARRAQGQILSAFEHRPNAQHRALARASGATRARFETEDIALAFQYIPRAGLPAAVEQLSLRPLLDSPGQNVRDTCTWLEVDLEVGDESTLSVFYDRGALRQATVQRFVSGLLEDFEIAAGAP